MPGSAQLRLRALNWSQVAEPRITPRNSLHPPSAKGGNMYAQRSHRTSAAGATTPYRAACLESPQILT
jgi:hypothetical protein